MAGITLPRLYLDGQKFGRLTVIREAPRRGRSRYWLCECECGKYLEVTQSSLRIGETRSCGCLNLDAIRARATTHGLSRTREYRIWAGVKTRCYDTGCHAYADYGGRGIVVCDRWRDSFENFLADMGPRPGPGYSIERRDNDGPYSPENCYWATLEQQACNKRSNRVLKAFGESHPLSEWSRRYGVNESTLRNRLKAGLSVEEALTRPLDPRRLKKLCEPVPVEQHR